MNKKIKSLKKHSLIRYRRLEGRIEEIESRVNLKSLNRKEKDYLSSKKEEFDKIVKKINFLNKIIISSFLILYFSFFSILLSDFVYSLVSNILGKIISIFGSTIFIISLFISKYLINLYYFDLEIITIELINFYLNKNK